MRKILQRCGYLNHLSINTDDFSTNGPTLLKTGQGYGITVKSYFVKLLVSKCLPKQTYAGKAIGMDIANITSDLLLLSVEVGLCHCLEWPRLHIKGVFMKSIFVSTLVVFLSSTSFANESLVQKLSTIFVKDNYTGTTDDGEKCNVNISKSRDWISIAVTPQSYNFKNDSGSSACIYNKACFSLNQSSEILALEKEGSEAKIVIERPAGGPDSASAKKMSLTLSGDEDAFKISVSEKIGLFNLKTVKTECTVRL